MVKKINYKRMRMWSEYGYILYRIFTIGTIIFFIGFAFLVLFVQFQAQYGLVDKVQQEYAKAVVKAPPVKSKPPLPMVSTDAKETIAMASSLISGISSNASIITTVLGILLVIISMISQVNNTRKSGFKDNFFEFLKLHRSNVENIKTKGKTGHDAFIVMYQELMEVIPLIEKEKLPLKPMEVYSVAYLAIFWGVGPSSSVILKDYLKINYVTLTDTLLDPLIRKLELLKRKRDIEIEKQKTDPSKGKNILQCMLDGHQSDLGHYFRHLYQMVTFISNEGSLRYFEKYYYGKTLRAQFSNHELAIFLFNANSPLGKNWEPARTSKARKLISYYALIKNVPPSLVSQLNIREAFPSITFEFDEK